MKIVQIEDFFHPDAGYQINVLTKYLAQKHEVYILCATMNKIPKYLTSFFGNETIAEKDALYEKKYGVKIIRIPLIGYWGNRFVFSNKIFTIIKELNPDVLYVHGNDSYIGIRILSHPNRFKCKIVSDSHMLDMASKSKMHNLFCKWYKKYVTPQIIKQNITVIRTQNDDYVMRRLGLKENMCPYIPLGSDMLLFHPDKNERQVFRKCNQINDDDFVILYAGKLDETKGGMLLARAVKEKFNSPQSVVVMIVGNSSGEYGEKIEEVLQQSDNRIIRFNTQTYENLAQFYKASDLVVFPRQCSLSFYDAQACGVPVLSENNNINQDRNSHENGWCFQANNIDSLRNSIIKILMLPQSEINRYGDNAYKFVKENFNYIQSANQYIEIIEKECTK